MPISAVVQAVFGHFQNLNLLALLHDLRDGRTAQQTWLSGSLLCPVAHGLPAGSQVQKLSVLGLEADLRVGCHFAALRLGAQPEAVLHFVRLWDEEAIRPDWLLQQLEAMWEERLADARVLQELLQDGPGVPEPEVPTANPVSQGSRGKLQGGG